VAPPQYVAPAAVASRKGAPIGGLLALAGGAAAIGSAWLPWLVNGNDIVIKPVDDLPALSDLTKDPTSLANGDYLLAAGIIAAVVGLVLLLKLAPRLSPLLAILVIAAGALVIGVEISTYNNVSELIKSDPTYSIGNGLYVGIGGGVVAVLGGLAALLHK
jgi:hypothetical protein